MPDRGVAGLRSSRQQRLRKVVEESIQIATQVVKSGPMTSLPARVPTGATSRPQRDHDASSGHGSVTGGGVEIVDGATVSVAVVTSRTEAELIVGMLRSHGLRAALAADDAGGQYPQMQMEGVRVMVAPSDEASARRLLAAADDTAGPVGPS
jgi:hypothetical protein